MELLKDLRLGIRRLVRSPLVAGTGVATLAACIASSTAMFTVVNAVLLQPLQYGHPERLVLVWMARRQKAGYGNPPAQVYVAWRERAKSFEQLAALADTGFDLRGNPPLRIAAAEATANFFSAVEVQPELGRVFTEEEARSGAHELVLSHSLWQNRFGSDRNILGQTVVLSGAPWTVIGVMPGGFSFVGNHDLWVPMELNGNRLSGHNALMPVGKLRRGASATQADAELDTIQQEIIHELPDIAASGFNSARVMSVRDLLLGRDARRMMIVLLASVGFVLLIGCVNVANLLLARGATQQRQIAVRFSLGATRARIVRQMVADATVLAGFGAAAGLTLAWLAVHYLATLPLLQAPGTPPVSIDRSVLLFVVSVTMLTVFASGVLPAWQTSLVSPSETLKASSVNLGSARHQRMRSLFVITEVALSVMLLASSGVLLRRFVDLLQVNPGFDPSGLLTMDVSRTRNTSVEAARTFYNEALQRVRALPGVDAAAVSTTLPMVGWQYGIPFRRPDQAQDAIQRQFGILNVVSSEYFQMLRLPIVRGRSFSTQDTATSAPVIIINHQLAQYYFKDEDPIGKRLLVGAPFDFKAEVARQIVGIAGDVKDSGMEQPIADDVYLPFEQYPVPWEYLSIRSRKDPTALLSGIRGAIAEVDKDQPLQDIVTMQGRINDSLQSSRFAMSLSGGFAALSLLLTAIGIYGVIAYITTQRTAEFGLRLALGASPAAVVRLVMKDGMKLVLVGSAIGVAAAVAIARVMSSAAEDVNAGDPLVFLAALVAVVAAALLAMWLPARRAAKVDPIVALRYE